MNVDPHIIAGVEYILQKECPELDSALVDYISALAIETICMDQSDLRSTDDSLWHIITGLVEDDATAEHLYSGVYKIASEGGGAQVSHVEGKDAETTMYPQAGTAITDDVMGTSPAVHPRMTKKQTSSKKQTPNNSKTLRGKRRQPYPRVSKLPTQHTIDFDSIDVHSAAANPRCIVKPRASKKPTNPTADIYSPDTSTQQANCSPVQEEEEKLQITVQAALTAYSNDLDEDVRMYISGAVETLVSESNFSQVMKGDSIDCKTIYRDAFVSDGTVPTLLCSFLEHQADVEGCMDAIVAAVFTALSAPSKLPSKPPATLSPASSAPPPPAISHSHSHPPTPPPSGMSDLNSLAGSASVPAPTISSTPSTLPPECVRAFPGGVGVEPPGAAGSGATSGVMGGAVTTSSLTVTMPLTGTIPSEAAASQQDDGGDFDSGRWAADIYTALEERRQLVDAESAEVEKRALVKLMGPQATATDAGEAAGSQLLYRLNRDALQKPTPSASAATYAQHVRHEKKKTRASSRVTSAAAAASASASAARPGEGGCDELVGGGGGEGAMTRRQRDLHPDLLEGQHASRRQLRRMERTLKTAMKEQQSVLRHAIKKMRESLAEQDLVASRNRSLVKARVELLSGLDTQLAAGDALSASTVLARCTRLEAEAQQRPQDHEPNLSLYLSEVRSRALFQLERPAEAGAVARAALRARDTSKPACSAVSRLYEALGRAMVAQGEGGEAVTRPLLQALRFRSENAKAVRELLRVAMGASYQYNFTQPAFLMIRRAGWLIPYLEEREVVRVVCCVCSSWRVAASRSLRARERIRRGHGGMTWDEFRLLWDPAAVGKSS